MTASRDNMPSTLIFHANLRVLAKAAVTESADSNRRGQSYVGLLVHRQELWQREPKKGAMKARNDEPTVRSLRIDV